MTNKPTVCIETTIPSFLTARPSKTPVVLAKPQVAEAGAGYGAKEQAK